MTKMAFPLQDISGVKQMLNAITSAVVLVDIQQSDMPIVWVNPAFEEHTGYSATEVMGRNCRFLQGDDREQPDLIKLRHAIANGLPCEVVLRNYRADGTLFWNELRLSPIVNAEGVLTHYVGIQNDVTKRQNLMDELQEMSLMRNSLFEQTNDAVFLLDLAGKHVQVNQRACDMFGYTYDEMLVASYRDLVVPDEHSETENIMARLLNGETLTPYERIFRRKDGTRFPAELNVQMVYDTTDTPVYVQSVLRDITERKQKEYQLQQSHNAIMRLVQQLPIGVQVFDMEGTCTEVNQAHLDLFGVERDNLVGKFNIFHDEFPVAKQVRSAARKARQGYYVRLPEIVFNFAEAQAAFADTEQDTRVLSVSFVPITDDAGDVVNFMGVNIDITEQKKSEKRKLAIQLERERVRVLSIFVETAAHEFRTPLSVISTSNFILQRYADNDRLLPHNKKIAHQVTRLSRLVDQLILMSKLESHTEIPRDVVDTNNLLKMIHETVQADWQSSRTFIGEIESDLPALKGHRAYLQEAVKQLLKNAYMATEKGDTITLRAYRTEAHVVIEVEDNGSGIAEVNMENIFTAFWRDDSAHTTPGFGIGLSIVKRVATLHGGTITAVSNEGEGSVFTLTLGYADGEMNDLPMPTL